MFATRLKILRKEKSKTQADMAEWLGVRRSTYGEYERGIITPPMDKIKILADYLGVSGDYLMGYTNFKTHEERQEKDAMDVSKNLEIILEYLEDNQSALTFDGEMLEKDSREILISNIQNGLKMANIINRNKRS